MDEDKNTKSMPTDAERRIEVEKQTVGAQIKNTTASSPVTRRPLSTEQLNALIHKSKTSPEKVRVPPVPMAELQDIPGEKTPYDAGREGPLSPATQFSSGGYISNNPADIHIGGGAPRNTSVYAEKPSFDGEKNTFYLKQKFAPVKPYKLPLPSGNVVELDTANKNKAAYLVMAMTEPGREIDWHGYNRLLETPHEGLFHGFARGLTNVWPQLLTGTLGYVTTGFADLMEGINTLAGDEDGAQLWTNLRNTAYNVVNDLQYDVTWHFGPKGIGDRDQNKFGVIAGSVVGTIPLAFTHNMAGLAAVNAFEAAEGAYQVRQAMEQQGFSTLGSAFAAAGTGAGVWLIGQAPEFVGVALRTWGVPAKSLTRLARMNPEAFNKLVRGKKNIIALAEGFSEPSQDFLVNAVSGEDNDWEGALETFFLSMLVARASMSFDKSNAAAAHLAKATMFKNFVKTHMDAFQKIVEQSGGAVSLENIDGIIDAVFNPRSDDELLNMIKEGMVANFDKLSDEDKQKLVSFIQTLNPDTNLAEEFETLDKTVDAMLDRSAATDVAAGRTPLTENQRALVKLMLRGVAAHQLVNFGILPSKMNIPQNIFGGYSDGAGGAAEFAEASTNATTGEITINNSLSEMSMPVGLVGTAPVEGNAAQQASASVKNEFSNLTSDQSLGFADLPHEFWHWIETQTNLPDVGAFMAAMQQLAETIVPGITQGKSGLELSEAYAYALGYAGSKAKEVLGLTGDVADYIDFMHNYLNAQNIAQGLSVNMKGYMDTFRGVLKANKSMLKDILNGYGSSQLKGAIKDFIKTGNTGPLKFEDLRALNAILSSISDAETRQDLGEIFDSPRDAQKFMYKYAKAYDALMAKDREGAAAKAAEYRKIANEKVGLGKEITPSTANEQTVAGKVDELLSEELTEEQKIDRSIYALDMSGFEISYTDSSAYKSNRAEKRQLMKQKRKQEGYSDEQIEKADKIQEQIDTQEAAFREQLMSMVPEEDIETPEEEQRRLENETNLTAQHNKEKEALQQQLDAVLKEKPVKQEPANTVSKPDIEPRKHLDETPYDTDTLVTGGYDDSPEKVLGYLENAISWGKEDGLTASAVQGHKVKLSSINKQLQIKLDPSFGDTKLDHRAAYIILAKHKLAEMKKQGKLTPEQELRAKNDLMFAVQSKMQSSYRGVTEPIAPKEIRSFRGENWFLSNMSDSPIEFNGRHYLNAEAAFQAQKVEDADRAAFENVSGFEARQMGRSANLSKEQLAQWDQNKYAIMQQILKAKFEQNPDLMDKLLSTKGSLLVEENSHGDTYWGVSAGKGQNNLGKILMSIRGDNGVSANRYGSRGDILNFLATKVAEDTATPDEEALYRSIAKFDKTIDDLYVDFGPYTPVDTARAAKTAALELAIDLNTLSASNDGTVKAIINGDISTSEEYLRAMLPEAMDKMVPFDVEPKFENDRLVYKKREKVRSLTEALADYIDALDKFIEDQQFEEERYDLLSDKPSRTEAQMIGILKSPKTTAELKRQARAYLGAAGQNANDPMAKYFTPNYNVDISDRYIGATDTSVARDILLRGKGSEAEQAGAKAILEAGAVQSAYLNPIRGFLKRDIINTPTPLEEMGMSLQEAEDQIRAAGLEPYDFLNGQLAELAKEKLSPDYVRKNLNNEDPNISLKTRRTMLARLLEEVPSIGESKNRAERLRVLHAISSAKVAVDQIFQDVIDSEDSYNHNPTKNVQAFESAEEFKASDRFDRLLAEQRARGYTEVVDASNLNVSDEIAFPYGNNFVRGVISFKYKTPAGATGFIILEDVDVAEKRKKDLTTVKPPLQIVASEMNIRNAGFLRKPLETADFSRYPELLSLVDDICAVRPTMKNYTRIAEAAVKEATEDMEIRSQIAKLEGVELESDEAANFDEDDPENDYYAVRSDVPEIDPGAFPLMEGGLTDEEFRELFNQTEEEYLRHLEDGVSTPGERQLMWERLRDKEEGLKPHFENYGKGLIKNIDALNEGLEERKMGKFGRALLLGAWQTGLDRKLRAIFGEKATNGVANTTVAASVAQEISEAKRHAFDKALTNDVFKGSRKNYENWLSKITAVSYKTKLANGQEVDVTKDEVLGIAWAKRAVEKKLVDAKNFTNPYERMQAFYGNTEELLSHLTEEDWAFINLALEAAADARGVNSLIPQYWPGSTIGDDYIRKGWGARLKNTPDNSTRVISSQQPLAATGAFASVMSIIGAKSLQESGLTTKLRTLRDILVFEDIDLSMYQQLNEDEVAIYNELKEKAAALKFNLEKKIGSTMFKWLIDNIDVDLKFNPLVRDMTKNPVMGGFQKVTRSVASSLLMLNLKQGYVNLGNYDMFLGLSNSSTAKFFTTDRINAWAHIREAWKLAMSIPEFKRRLEQSGLSEQMRRVADMNEESLLKDIQQALYKGDNGKAGDLVGAINTLSKISAKYGLATNVVPDLVGIALGTYAVWNDVLAKNGGNVEKAQNEIVAHVLNRVSSSNYMTRSAATKLLHRAGLEALVAFKNDQLQKVGMICEAALTLMNSSDPAVRRAAWKDIQAAAYSTLRYIAIQAGWIAAMVQLASGHDLDDEEKEYLYEATVREVLSQIGDTTQMGSFVVQLLTGIYEGRDMGMTLIPFGGAQRASTAFRKGNFIKGAGETGALLGITPVAPGAVRLIDGLVRMASEDEKEQAVGRLMVAGRSEPTAQKMMGYSRSQKTGKLRNKQSRKKEKEEK